MDVWIETPAGNLIGTPVTAIIVRPGEGGNGWEVCVAASAHPSVFASGLTDRDEARRTRNALAVALSTAASATGTSAVRYDAPTQSVLTENLEA
ncbi:hypothetical protein [Arthrobacter sp. IK3]|uniref:hypothetical protein n=1 Tax=Arthrobacter sp. IK3 TaxID=3448169 RepID=UPI003EE3B432